MSAVIFENHIKSSKSYFSAISMICICIVCLPIYKGGYRPLPTAIFMVASSIVFFLMQQSSVFEVKKYWVLIWLLVSLAIFLEPGVLLPITFQGNIIQSGIDLDQLYTWAYFTATGIFALAVSQLKKHDLRWVFFAVMVSSLFQALYGLNSFANDSTSILGLWEKEHYLKSATGTFVNRNIYAGMLALSYPLVLMSILTKQLPGLSLSRFPRVFLFSLFYSSFILAAILSSQSRMGVAAAVVGVFVFSFIHLRSLNVRSQLFAFFSAKYFPFAVAFLVLLFLLWFGIGDLGSRYARLENGDSRIEVWQSLFSLPFEVWLKGIGAGAFNDIFNQVRPVHYRVEMRYAHNDYLQFVLQFGLVWSVIILISFIVFVVKCLPRGNWGMRSGALASLAVLAIHSIVDSNLQIPGSAIIAWVSFGILMNPDLAETDETSFNVVHDRKRSKEGKKLTDIRGKEPKKHSRRSVKRKLLEYFRSD